MSFQRGEVVMVEWLYSDRTGSKVRPAVVVQANFLNGLIADTVLVSITRKARSAAATEVVIDPGLDAGSGLRHVSIASCNNFLTIDQVLIQRVIGALSTTTMHKIDAGVKTALELP